VMVTSSRTVAGSISSWPAPKWKMQVGSLFVAVKKFKPEMLSVKYVLRPMIKLKLAGKLAVFVASSRVNCGTLNKLKTISCPRLAPTIRSKVTAPSSERCRTTYSAF
jgi:hypothetical protein